MAVLELPNITRRQWKRTLTLEQFGGVGDDATNNDSAFSALIAATQQYDRWLFAPHAVYRHNSIIKPVGKHNLTVDGWNSTLRATNQGSSALWFDQCNDLQVNGLTCTVDSTSRLSAWEVNAMIWTYCNRAEVNRTKSVGSAATGYFIEGCNDCTFDRPEAWNSRADGFHITGGSKGIRAFSPIVHNAGDDGIACVSYASNTTPVTDVWIQSPKLYWQSNGRGMTIVGGTNIHYSDIYIFGSRAAGLMLAVEGPPPNNDFTTKGILNCSVQGGRIVNCNAAAANEAHGGILVLNQRPSSSGVTMVDVLVSEIEIRDMPRTNVAPIQVLNNGSAATMTNVRLRNILLSGNRSTTPISIDSGITLAEQSIAQGGKWSSFGQP